MNREERYRHRARFHRSEQDDWSALIHDEMRMGMLDQGSAGPDGSPNLSLLIGPCRRERLGTGLRSYLRRLRGFSGEQLAAVARELERDVDNVVEFERNEEVSDRDR